MKKLRNKHIFIFILLSICFIGLSIPSISKGQSSTSTTYRLRRGTTLPTICSPNGNNVFYKTDTGMLYLCTATNTWSAVTLGAGFTAGLTTKTANYTATSNDYTIVCNATSGNITITLPAAASNTGKIYNIKKVDVSANTVTIDATASETIDGVTTKVISVQFVSVQIQSDGTQWWIL